MRIRWPSTVPEADRPAVVAAARWAQRAYAPPAEWPEAQFVECAECDAQAYLFFDAALDALVLVARGSSSATDWACDADMLPVPLAGVATPARVHSGFHRQFAGLQPVVARRVADHLAADPAARLLCCGHSLGSAVAAIAAAVFSHAYPGRVGYVGFGNPRTGDAGFARAVSACAPCVRVKHGRDPVCAAVLPILGYTHFGCEMHFGRRDPRPDLPNVAFAADHDAATYAACLAADDDGVAAGLKWQWLRRLLTRFFSD